MEYHTLGMADMMELNREATRLLLVDLTLGELYLFIG